MKKMLLPLMVLVLLLGSSLSFVWTGIQMHSQVLTEETTFHSIQDSYFILSKTERDSAPTGSELNKQLTQIQDYPSELLRLKLVGVGKILTGIFLMLVAIAFLLFMMPIRLAILMQEKKLDVVGKR